jgi:predicted regulator of Ras-like GTPase activity (Roadblock/LC7/MglB family)
MGRALSYSRKIKMLGYIKNLLRKWVETPDEAQAAPAVTAAPAPGRKYMTPPLQGATPGNRVHQNGRGLELPIQPILAGLPLELQPHLKNPDAGALTLCISLEKVLAQLSQGSVRIPFGELRQAAPNLFTPEMDWDSIMVPLPLAEILARLNPALITRRRVQKKVEVPADISSPFDQNNRSMIVSVGPHKPESVPTATPHPRQLAPAPLTPAARAGLTFAPTPLPPGAVAPAAPAVNPVANSLPLRQPSTNPRPAQPAAVPPPARPASESEALLISLNSLAESWPEAVRHELVQLNLVETKVALPIEVVEHALKQGRIVFPWKTLRSWITPSLLPAPSAHDSTMLELPLKVVAPSFLARQKEAGKLQKKVVVDDEIPNLFFGFPRSETTSTSVASAASPAAPKVADTNFYVWDDSSDRARIQDDEAKHGPSPGTKFVAKYATPNEVVSRAAALEGVAGALIALPDGLMVANRLPADLNGDTLAAFLPQIFGKVNQCTKELRMGELNNVHFTVGNVPWKIFRVNAIFFAAFGRVGEALPTAPLAALAAELDHRAK